MTMALQSVIRNQGEGNRRAYMGGLVSLIVTGDETNGAFSLAQNVLPVGFATPFHRHSLEEETFYLLDGEAEFLVDGKLFRVATGAVVFLPRGSEHGFRIVGDKPARMLNLISPAGFENFFLELSEPAQTDTLSAPGVPDVQRLLATSARYGVQIMGPLAAAIDKVQ